MESLIGSLVTSYFDTEASRCSDSFKLDVRCSCRRKEEFVCSCRYDDFTRACQEQHRKHADILANFERDMERLRATELHPVLKTESRR
jgi:hypothetical protein